MPADVNYIIKYVTGDLKITKAPLTITVIDQDYTYTGEPQGEDGSAAYTSDFDAKVKVEGLVGGDVLSSIMLNGQETNAGEYADKIVASEAAVTFNHVTDKNIDDNYDVTYVAGKLTIDPAAITITADDQTKVYDNDETTDPELTATLAGVPDKGVEPVYTVTREEGQDVGDYVITVTADADANPNYTITTATGTFTITKATLTITTDAKSKLYGTADPELTVTVTGLVEGETIPEGFLTITRDPGEDVGTYAIHVTGADSSTQKVSQDATKQPLIVRTMVYSKNAAEIDAVRLAATKTFKAENYDITYDASGELTINPRNVTLTSASGAKFFDGTPFQMNNPAVHITVGGDGFAEGEGATYNITGSQTDVGRSANTFTYTLNANTKAGNYKITTVDGVLTVVPEEVPLGMIGTFSFYFMSDGNLKADGKKAEAFKDTYKWIKENNERLGALAIIGSGNAVADGKDEAAWKLIKDELNGLNRKENELPYYNIAGRNEVNGDALDYETYTKNKLCEVNERNEYEDGQIWYQPYDEQQLLFVGIGYQKLLDPEKATDEEKEAQEKWLKYVNDVLARYPEHTAVLLVNDFIEHDPDSNKDDGRLTEFGKLIEEKIVAGNDNVALVLCGNAEGTARWHKAYGERNVNAIMYNYQNDEENGLGFFRIITLNGEAKTITVTTYSPTLDKDSYDEDHPEYDFYVIEDAF